jgi:hypothetical protein
MHELTDFDFLVVESILNISPPKANLQFLRLMT